MPAANVDLTVSCSRELFSTFYSRSWCWKHGKSCRLILLPTDIRVAFGCETLPQYSEIIMDLLSYYTCRLWPKYYAASACMHAQKEKQK